MKTLGIDLASDPRKTGVCVMAWQQGRAVVDELRVGADDEALLAVHERVDVTGIDAPFGWPAAFARMVDGDADMQAKPWAPARRDELRFRATDFRVRELTGRWPLSVSSDLIAVPAMRCVGLLYRMGVTDRAGDGRVYETYPASGLAAWGLPPTGYKGTAKRPQRERLVADLRRNAGWLDFPGTASIELVLEHDDALDALVASLIARAAVIGETVVPTESECDLARTEGWIHVPKAGSLSRLA